MTTNFNLKQYIKVFGDDMVGLLNRFSISFNKNIADDTNYRSFESIACGAMLMSDNNPAYKDLGFISGENCLLYSSTKDITEFVENAFTNPAFVKSVAERGYNLSKKHTYKKRAESIAKFLATKI